LQLAAPANVAGKQLAAGEYTVKWDGTGPSVQVEILKGKNVVATVPAQVVTLEHPSNYDSAVVNTNGDGSRVLSQIRFSGKKLALTVGGEGAGAAAEAASTSKYFRSKVWQGTENLRSHFLFLALVGDDNTSSK